MGLKVRESEGLRKKNDRKREQVGIKGRKVEGGEVKKDREGTERE